MTEEDIKHIKGFLSGIYVILLVIAGASLHPIIGAVYSWLAIVVLGFYTAYLAEKIF